MIPGTLTVLHKLFFNNKNRKMATKKKAAKKKPAKAKKQCVYVPAGKKIKLVNRKGVAGKRKKRK